MQRYPTKKTSPQHRAHNRRAVGAVAVVLLVASIAGGAGLIRGQQLAMNGDYIIGERNVAISTNWAQNNLQNSTASTQTESTLDAGTFNINGATYTAQPGDGSWFSNSDYLYLYDNSGNKVGWAKYDDQNDRYLVSGIQDAYYVPTSAFTPNTNTTANQSNDGQALDDDDAAPGQAAGSGETPTANTTTGGNTTKSADDSSAQSGDSNSSAFVSALENLTKAEDTNVCATKYVYIGTDGKPAIADCYDKNASNPNAAKYLVQKLSECIEKETGASQAENAVKKLMCITDAKVSLNKAGAVEITKGDGTTLPVPQACSAWAQAIKALRDGNNAQNTASTEDKTQCTWKGAVTCFPKDMTFTSAVPLQLSFSGYACCNKADEACIKAATQSMQSALGGITSGGITNQTQGLLGKIKSSLGNLSDLSKGFLGGLAKSLLKGLSGTGSGSGSSSSASVEKPTCAISATDTSIVKGESTTLQWRTENAARVDVSPIGSGLSANANSTVYPTVSTTYKVTAYPKSSSVQSCSASVSVTVESGTTESGSYPPQMSCSPSLIQAGMDANVTFSCTTNADGSTGTNLNTNDGVSGTIAVSPTDGTVYEISCTKDGEVIGTNSCSVGIGEPLFDIVAYPTSAERGERVRISWLSLFMSACRVTGPRGFDYSMQKGVVITEPFSSDDTSVANQNIRSAIYSATCQTLFGTTVTKDISVDLVE